jgi:hypothetical protein
MDRDLYTGTFIFFRHTDPEIYQSSDHRCCSFSPGYTPGFQLQSQPLIIPDGITQHPVRSIFCGNKNHTDHRNLIYSLNFVCVRFPVSATGGHYMTLAD